MKGKILSASIAFLLLLSLLGTSFVIKASNATSFPEYIGVDWQSGLAGKVEMPTVNVPSGYDAGSASSAVQLASTPAVGDWVWDWYLRAITGGLYPYMQLRALAGNVEVYVAQNETLLFPEGDPRNDNPLDWYVTDEMCQHVAEEFNAVIYPTDANYFGPPQDRDGTNTVFEQLGWPAYRWEWIATDNPQRVIIKIFNIQDENYYDPTYPYYTVGFYSPTYTQVYYNRNMVHIDNWRYWQRLGERGHVWYADHPELNVTRPYVYESTVAHEFQHNIHDDWQPFDEAFMNEGCSMFAEFLCGYGIEANYLNSYFATPDNSLTLWGDQGDINILADYGVAALWTVYLSDHYGGADLIRHFVQSGIPGIEGINAALTAFGYEERFADVYHDWRLANLIRSDFPGNKKYNYKSLSLNDPAIIPVRMYAESGLPLPWKKGTDYGTTKTILGYDTGVADLGPYGTDYIAFKNWRRPGLLWFDGDDVAIDGWRIVDKNGNHVWWSGAVDLKNYLLYREVDLSGVASATLTFDTSYDLEPYWDYGFVQVSTDGGNTWTSLENEYTTYDHDPSAHPEVIANLPGLTGNKTWLTMSFDLSAYAGQKVQVGFRCVTDWATHYAGWFIDNIAVPEIGFFDDVESGRGDWLTVPPIQDADFQITVVQAVAFGKTTIYLPYDMCLNHQTETGAELAFACGAMYTILVVTPVQQLGSVDYQFKATYVPPRFWKGF